MSALSCLGLFLIVSSPAWIPGLVNQIARGVSLTRTRRARGARLGRASRRAPQFDLIAHGQAARWDRRTETYVRDRLAR